MAEAYACTPDISPSLKPTILPMAAGLRGRLGLDVAAAFSPVPIPLSSSRLLFPFYAGSALQARKSE
jgi:hypothetical protein